MARPSIVIDKDGLEKEIQQAEATNTFDNQSRLFEFLCSSPWAATIKDSLGRPFPVKPINVYQKVVQFGIQTKTPKGKKGGGNPNLGKVKATGGKKDRSANKLPLLQSTPELYKGLAAKVSSGSMKAAIKLKCLECCCFDRKEVSACNIKSCSLWAFLPRKSKISEKSEENT